MYEFVDVTEVSAGAMLPAEALQINGEYIENQINGYRTLSVAGREALSPDVSSYTTGIRDGSKLQNKRYPERIITVQYLLAAESNEAFREAYNKLGAILDVQDAELIFADETDKYFVGTPCIIGVPNAGTNRVIGEFEILCTDPFKYSVVEYEATLDADAGAILIDYNGTYRSFPTLQADFYGEDEGAGATLQGAGDCGYVAFFNEDSKIVQLGDPDEVDSEEAFAKSQTMMNQLFTGQYAWGDTAQALWSLNAAFGLPTEVSQGGYVASAVAEYAAPTTPASTSAMLLKTASTASDPKINYTVTAKSSGRTANSVKVTFAITGSLGSSGSYFLTGYGLKASVYVGGAWHDVTLKKTSDKWRGRTGHTVNLSTTVTGLATNTASLTGIKFKVTRTDNNGTAGTLGETACSKFAISTYVADVPETYYLAPASYGGGTAWHGTSITRTIDADAAGEVGAANFTLTYKNKMSIGNGADAVNQLGAFQAQIVDTDGNNLAGVRIHKNKAGTWASVIYYIKGVKVYGEVLDLSYGNENFSANSSHVPTSSITKSGATVVFSIAGTKKSFNDDTITDTKAAKVSFVFEQYGTSPVLTHNGLYWAKFVKNNCDTQRDIPNKFSANDTVEADCRSGDIRLNGAPAPELGALGNDWEDFYLSRGLNQIGVSYSDWVNAEYAPTFKVRYREVFL